MRKSKHTEEQIASALRQAETGPRVAELVHFLIQACRISKRRATIPVGVSRSHFYYRHDLRDDCAERTGLRENPETRLRYGMWRTHTLLRREGWVINQKKTHRPHSALGHVTPKEYVRMHQSAVARSG